MAKEPKTGRDGIDRWTSNGVGVRILHIPEKNKKAVEQIKKEMEAKRKAEGKK